jgi:autotransporter translocation and assembly factor TamB
MTWRKRGALALLSLAMLAMLATLSAATVLWVTGTASGTAWLVGRLLADAPQVTIARIRGSLLQGLLLEDVRLRTARDELDIESLALDWRPAALLAGTLAFDRAAASRATYRRVPGSAAGGGAPPELPWPLRLEQASVAALSVTVAQRTVLLDDSRFTATYGGGRLELTQLATSIDAVALAANASFVLGAAIDLDVAGEWSAPLAGVAASGSATLTGTWPQLRVRHELAMPFAATTNGRARAAGSRSAERWPPIAMTAAAWSTSEAAPPASRSRAAASNWSSRSRRSS